MTNSAPSSVVTMEYTKSGVFNEEMRRRSQASSSFWLLKIGGETSPEVRMIEVKVEASQNLNTRILHVTIATRIGIS